MLQNHQNRSKIKDTISPVAVAAEWQISAIIDLLVPGEPGSGRQGAMAGENRGCSMTADKILQDMKHRL